MSRTAAAGKRRKKIVERVKDDGSVYNFTEWTVQGGCVDFDAVKARISAKGIVLRGAGADECPEVYKKLSDVIEAHA